MLPRDSGYIAYVSTYLYYPDLNFYLHKGTGLASPPKTCFKNKNEKYSDFHF